MSDYKLCAVCNEELPIDCFSVNNASSDGLQRKCRQCDRDYQAKRRAKEGYHESQAEYYQKRHEELKDDIEYRARKLLNASRARAKRKGLDHDIDLDSFLEVFPDNMVCPVFGTKMEWGVGGNGPDSPSIDRIDSSKGYTLDNITVISWRANRLKCDATLSELKQLVNYLEDLF